MICYKIIKSIEGELEIFIIIENLNLLPFNYTE